MRTFMIPAALTLALATIGCKTTNTKENPVTSDTMQLRAGALPKLTCPANTEPYSFTMTTVGGALPSLDQLKLPAPKDPGSEQPSVVRPDSLDNIRLDLCVAGDHVQLQRIFQVRDHVRILNVSQDARVVGLNELFFDQNYDKLEIVVPFDQTKGSKPGEDKVLIIKGNGATDAAAVATGTAVAGQIYLSQEDPVVFGTIEREQSDVATP